MAFERILIHGAIGFFAGIVLFFFGFKWFIEKQVIENIPTSKIRSISMGLVEVFGQIVPINEQIAVSPFSNRECVYYNYKIQERISSGKHSYWATIKSGEKHHRFLVRDETGPVMVDPVGARIDIPPAFSYNSGLMRDPPKEVKNFLAVNNLSFEGFFGINKTMKFEEKALFPNEEIFVLGEATDNPFVEEATAQQSVHDVMIQKGKNEKFFYISNKSEKEVLKKMSSKAYLAIGAGILIATISLAVIVFFKAL